MAYISVLILAMHFFSFSLHLNSNISILYEEELIQKTLKDSIIDKTFEGWWIYGEGDHLFKDKNTLAEYVLEFPHENSEELKALYLAICEMEYFPMECNIKGYLTENILENKRTLTVSDFEIIYIQGCED